MADLDLEPIKAMLAAATPGPWRPCPQKSFVFGPKHEMIASRARIAEDNGIVRGDVEIRGFGAGLPMDANHDLIVAAPATIAALVAEVERLRLELVEEREVGNLTGRLAAAELGPICEALGVPSDFDGPGTLGERCVDAIEAIAEHVAELEGFIGAIVKSAETAKPGEAVPFVRYVDQYGDERLGVVEGPHGTSTALAVGQFFAGLRTLEIRRLRALLPSLTVLSWMRQWLANSENTLLAIGHLMDDKRTVQEHLAEVRAWLARVEEDVRDGE